MRCALSSTASARSTLSKKRASQSTLILKELINRREIAIGFVYSIDQIRVVIVYGGPKFVSVCDNQTDTKRHDWVALDPGVRTFMTGYSPTPGVCFQVAPKDINKLYRLCKHLDAMISKIAKSTSKRERYKVKKVLSRLRHRIHHLVDEVHWKCIHFLVTRFKNIIIPPFNTSQMVKRGSRRIRSKTARQMLCWRHYTFRRRLLDKVKLLTDTRVFVRGEEYTTKACTNCLQLHHKIGGNKLFKCPQCFIVVDRDVSGSRNIFIKNISAIE